MKKLAALVLIAALAGFAFAGEDPKPILKKGDVEKFIKTYPALSEELDKFGIELEGEAGNYTVPEPLRYNQELLGILKKHGWDEHFFAAVGTIMRGYINIVYKQEVKSMDKEVAEAIEKIEGDPNLSDAMKKQMVEQMKASQKMMSGGAAVYGQEIHPDDFAQVTENIEGLKEVLEEKK